MFANVFSETGNDRRMSVERSWNCSGGFVVMTVRALLRAILLAVLVAATCQTDEITADYSAAATTDRPEATEDEVRSG